MHGPGRHLAALVAALCLAIPFALAACGGGGGAPAKTATPAPADPTPAPTEADRNSVRTADSGKTLESARRAADSLPRFESVTQSTNRNASGITTDRARAAFNGAGVAVTVTRADGSTLTLDSSDSVHSYTLPNRVFRILGPARIGRAWLTANIADRAATVSRLAVTTANDDSNDWLASGYWLHIAGQNLLATAPTVTRAEMGAFVDGPELRSPPNLPTTQRAHYEGLGAGAYATRYGSGYTARGITPGSSEIGEFRGIIELNASFANNTISGCFGCKGNLLFTGVFEDGATGAQRTFEDVPTDYQLRLGTAQIESNGTFRADNVTLSSARVRQAGLGFTEDSGSWGGKFSNIPGTHNEPRLAAGTFGGRAALSDGSQAAYIGAFVAGKQ